VHSNGFLAVKQTLLLALIFSIMSEQAVLNNSNGELTVVREGRMYLHDLYMESVTFHISESCGWSRCIEWSERKDLFLKL
jgi:hypothetical protein